MGNSASNDINKSKNEPTSVKESDASRLVWANHDLIHEIMDFLVSFEDLSLIPRIRIDTSDSLFSYRFKNRKRQECDLILFLEKARTYYSSFIAKALRFRKSSILSLRCLDNYRRFTDMKFYSLNIDLNHIGEDHVKVLAKCSRLTLKNFHPSQLSLICKPNISFPVNTLKLQVSNTIEYNKKSDIISLSLESTLSNITRVSLKGHTSVLMFTNISKILVRLPSLQSLNLAKHFTLPMSPLLMPFLPNSLVTLVMNVYGFNGNIVDLRYLILLKALFICGKYFVSRCILLPNSLEYFTIPDSIWHENQIIPSSVKLFRSYHNNRESWSQFSRMQTAIWKSNIEHIGLFGYTSLQLDDFKISSSLKNIECVHSSCSSLIRDIKRKGSFPDGRFTHLFYTPFHHSIICGNDLPNIWHGSNIWYHIPMEHIRMSNQEIILPIPLENYKMTICRV